MGPIKIHPGLRNSSKVATLLRSTSGSTTKRCTSSPYSTGFAEGSTAVQKNDGAILSPKEDLKQEPHSQGSQALPNDLSAKAVVEMGNRLNEFRERGRYKLWVEPYEKAVANGYVGPYEIWKLSKHPSVLHKRTTGASPYITTLKKLERCPLPEELIRTTSDRNRHRFARNVIVENQVVGMAVFHIAPKGEREPWKPIWVRPYFDHEAKHLRFQLPDGSDHAYSKSLTELANSAARPILYLAYNEGLIDLVPGA
ncbi:hypothetical protein FRB95_005800 [Tulasnella sp. JGI-2019a]|nr:hypothetical protein FRB95_005800 [Tulasnella sp. JGI-2019a]